MNESIYLIAVTLSEHASLKITSYRKKIFREFGYVSALALPPLIPLAWFQDRPNLETVPFVEKPGIISINSIVKDKSAFFLSFPLPSAQQVVLDWQALFSGNGNGANPGLFPLHPGIYICSHDSTNPAEKADLPIEPAIEKLEINDFRISCFMIEFKSAGTWWEDLFYAQLWSKRIT
ncbi:MAG: hypothetical protein KAQ69_13305 [Spirochaetales bacterium]|nr:hypothetical protein [Spirochaetales bacterium]